MTALSYIVRPHVPVPLMVTPDADCTLAPVPRKMMPCSFADVPVKEIGPKATMELVVSSRPKFALVAVALTVMLPPDVGVAALPASKLA